jgi:hypothetical protein
MKQETKTSEKPAQPTLTLDVDLYKHYLDNSDLTEERKQEVLETLWNIVCEFVQMGFNVHPVQQAQQSRSHTVKGEQPHADL